MYTPPPPTAKDAPKTPRVCSFRSSGGRYVSHVTMPPKLESMEAYKDFDDAPALMTIDEACRFLNVPKTHLRHLRNRRDIPATKIGQRVMFDKRRLLRWLQDNREEPT